MTIAVGLIADTEIWLGADRASVAANSYDLTVRDDPKVFRWGPLLVAVAGSPRLGQAIQYGPPPPTDDGSDAHGYLVREVVPRWRETLREAGHLRTNSGEEGVEGYVLVAHPRGLFVVMGDFYVRRAPRWAAIGCGENFALAALYALDAVGEIAPPRRALGIALKAAYVHSGGVRPPFDILQLDREE